MDTIKLRILTCKSILNFGRFDGWSIQKIIDMQKTGYLRWIYFNLEGLSFSEDVLDSIHLYSQYRIKKPGKAPEKHRQLMNYQMVLINIKEPLNAIKRSSHMKKDNRRHIARNQISRFFESKKSVLQYKNQGH